MGGVDSSWPPNSAKERACLLQVGRRERACDSGRLQLFRPIRCPGEQRPNKGWLSETGADGLPGTWGKSCPWALGQQDGGPQSWEARRAPAFASQFEYTFKKQVAEYHGLHCVRWMREGMSDGKNGLNRGLVRGPWACLVRSEATEGGSSGRREHLGPA